MSIRIECELYFVILLSNTVRDLATAVLHDTLNLRNVVVGLCR
jgi:hypothetical protein